MSKTVKPHGWRKVAIASWPKPHDPTTYGVLELDATPALAYLDKLRERKGVSVTMLALVLKALAHAMAQEPASTRMLRFGRWVERDSLDLFVQVDRGGRDLSGLKLTNVPSKGILDVAQEIATRAGAVRAEASPEQLRRSTSVTDRMPMWLMPLALWIQDRLAHDWGLAIPALGIFPDPFGAAMVTNIGSLGLEVAFPPVPPIARCSLVMAMGRVREKPWVVDGQVLVRPVLTLGVAIDHRALDGAQASRMAQAFTEVLAEPERFFGPDGEG
ncbi:Dihydrolipoyllysine-residue acetyltransferase component of pyruvate dehydrogenase complex [compost metagenome]